jgi:hypothetical protein
LLGEMHVRVDETGEDEMPAAIDHALGQPRRHDLRGAPHRDDALALDEHGAVHEDAPLGIHRDDHGVLDEDHGKRVVSGTDPATLAAAPRTSRR